MTRKDDRIPTTLMLLDGSMHPMSMCHFCGRIADHAPTCSTLSTFPQCSFCGRTDAPTLVRGRAGFICRECAVDALTLFGGAS